MQIPSHRCCCVSVGDGNVPHDSLVCLLSTSRQSPLLYLPELTTCVAKHCCIFSAPAAMTSLKQIHSNSEHGQAPAGTIYICWLFQALRTHWNGPAEADVIDLCLPQGCGHVPSCSRQIPAWIISKASDVTAHMQFSSAACRWSSELSGLTMRALLQQL